MDESSTLTNAPPERIRVSLADEQSALAVDRAAICTAVRTVLGETWHGLATISVAIVDDPTIHRLNQEYLDHDYATDVLSFVLDQNDEQLEGEIVASAEQALEHGPQYGWSADDELLLYVVHGALHLAGYDDSTDLDAAEMRRQEVYFLEKLGCASRGADIREWADGRGRPMNVDAATWGVLGCMLLVSIAATGARALCEFSRSELVDICRRGKVPDLFGEILRQHQRVARGLESFVVVATSTCVVAATVHWLLPLVNQAVQIGSFTVPRGALIVFGGIAMGAILSAAVLWIPWTLSKLWAAPILYYTWTLWKGIAWLMSPLTAGGGLFDALVHRLANRTPTESNEESFEEEIRSIVTEGHREGLLEEDAREMIESVIELGDATVSEIMTPRTDMQMFQVDLPWDEVLEYVIHVGHTRIPVYDKNRDDIVGILFIKDMLPELAKSAVRPRRTITEILRKAYFVPQTKAIDDLLQEFQQTGNHMAVVLDEYGGVSGLVTIEDVLEEIVGEIIDEYDEGVVEDIQRTGESTWDVSGRSHIDEINARLGLQLPEDGDFDTIAGFVFSELGRIPSVGESIDWQEAARIVVLEATGRRIDRLRIELLGKTADEAV